MWQAVVSGALGAVGGVLNKAEQDRAATDAYHKAKEQKRRARQVAAQDSTMGVFKDPFTGKKTIRNQKQEEGSTGGAAAKPLKKEEGDGRRGLLGQALGMVSPLAGAVAMSDALLKEIEEDRDMNKRLNRGGKE